MKKKKLLILLILCLVFVFQKTEAEEYPTPLGPYRHAIRNNVQLTTGHYNYSQIWPLSLAYILRTKRGNAHEFELNEIVISNFDDRNPDEMTGRSHKGMNVLTRYQYNYHFLKRETKFSPYLGPTVMMNVGSNRYESLNRRLDHYPISTKKAEFTFALAPGVSYSVSKRVFLDFSIPLELYRIEFARYRFEYPGWPEEKQKSFSKTDDNLRMFDYFRLRIGLGVNF